MNSLHQTSENCLPDHSGAFCFFFGGHFPGFSRHLRGSLALQGPGVKCTNSLQQTSENCFLDLSGALCFFSCWAFPRIFAPCSRQFGDASTTTKMHEFPTPDCGKLFSRPFGRILLLFARPFGRILLFFGGHFPGFSRHLRSSLALQGPKVKRTNSLHHTSENCFLDHSGSFCFFWWSFPRILASSSRQFGIARTSSKTHEFPTPDFGKLFARPFGLILLFLVVISQDFGAIFAAAWHCKDQQ